jgi:hypothetical protein
MTTKSALPGAVRSPRPMSWIVDAGWRIGKTMWTRSIGGTSRPSSATVLKTSASRPYGPMLETRRSLVTFDRPSFSS